MTDEQPTTQTPSAPPVQAPSADVSQRTIVVLVILTVLLSFIGAWAGISATMHAPQAAQGVHDAQGTAEVGFVIGAPQSLKETSAGLVAFEIGS